MGLFSFLNKKKSLDDLKDKTKDLFNSSDSLISTSSISSSEFKQAEPKQNTPVEENPAFIKQDSNHNLVKQTLKTTPNNTNNNTNNNLNSNNNFKDNNNNNFNSNNNFKDNNQLKPVKTTHSELITSDIRNIVAPPKQEAHTFNVDKLKKEKEYIDEVLNSDLNLEDLDKDSVEKIENLIHPELKKKIHDHSETISINDEEDDDIKDYESDKRNFKEEIKTNFKKTQIKKPTDKKEQISKEINKKIKVDKPTELDELPDFNTVEEVKEERIKRKLKGDLFVKVNLYREVLHSNLVIKEDIKICDNKLLRIEKAISTQNRTYDKLKNSMETIQNKLLLIDSKLFDNAIKR